MANQEVGRWQCAKCGKTIVAAGLRSPKFMGNGGYAGPCPWSCGAWVNRSFRSIRPGDVLVFRGDEWDERPLETATAGGWAS